MTRAEFINHIKTKIAWTRGKGDKKYVDSLKLVLKKLESMSDEDFDYVWRSGSYVSREDDVLNYNGRRSDD